MAVAVGTLFVLVGSAAGILLVGNGVVPILGTVLVIENILCLILIAWHVSVVARTGDPFALIDTDEVTSSPEGDGP